MKTSTTPTTNTPHSKAKSNASAPSSQTAEPTTPIDRNSKSEIRKDISFIISVLKYLNCYDENSIRTLLTDWLRELLELRKQPHNTDDKIESLLDKIDHETQGWISIDDELPESNELVFAKGEPYGNRGSMISLAVIDSEGDWYAAETNFGWIELDSFIQENTMNDLEGVTHWSHLTIPTD